MHRPILSSCACALLSLSIQAQGEREPWRLAERIGLPDWIDLTFEHRSRFQSLSNEYRAAFDDGHNQVFAIRNLLGLTFRHDSWRFVGEAIDARVLDERSGGFLSTAVVDAVDLLQAYVGWSGAGFGDDDRLDLRLGRQTLDFGARRLVARNRFRNTINAFTGLSATWANEKDRVDLWYTMPVQRLPRAIDDLAQNELEFDEELERTRFFGVHGVWKSLVDGLETDGYVYVVDEEDQDGVNTRDRELVTIGVELEKKARPGTFHFDLDTAFQFGQSRASSSAADTEDLDHLAQFHLFTFGYTFDRLGTPRVEALFDYASGDADPNDDENNRFDSLYGAQVKAYGPTDIFAPFLRSNIVSPGLRLHLFPAEGWNIILTHRYYFLASDQDAWVRAGVVDPAGDSGSELAQMSDLRFKYDPAPNVQIEGGLSYVMTGEFADDAPNANGADDFVYGYLGVRWRF